MSVSTKPRSPPPPYREPLPGSTYATALARPSVITQAPKREMPTSRDRDSKDAIVAGKNNLFSILLLNLKLKYFLLSESISMIDPVIDEHFRRSLGADYINIFGKKKTTTNNTTPTTNTTTIAPTIPSTPSPPISNNIKKPVQCSKTTITTTIEPDTVAMSVDDHFAKALGNDTWRQLQAADSRNDSNNKQSQQQDQTASVNSNYRSRGKN